MQAGSEAPGVQVAFVTSCSRAGDRGHLRGTKGSALLKVGELRAFPKRKKNF